MTELLKLKSSLNKNKNRNLRFVKIRSEHNCNCCGKTQQEGTECLTVNHRFGSRLWYCLDCVDLFLQLKKVQIEKDCVAFGDEGAWLALNDYQAELEGEFYGRKDG